MVGWWITARWTGCGSGYFADDMNILTDAEWTTLIPAMKKACPRLTADDLAECQQRVDLLTAKIQSRHWISRVEAQNVVFTVLHQQGILHVSA